MTCKVLLSVSCARCLMASVALGMVVPGPAAIRAAEVALLEGGRSSYQIVVPNPSGDALVEGWIMMAARLVQYSFARQGAELPIVAESKRLPGRPAMLLGDTQFARDHGVNAAAIEDWGHVQQLVGKDLILAGRDRRDVARSSRGEPKPLALAGTLKACCDFLREQAGLRLLFMNNDPGIYPVDDLKRQRQRDALPLQLDPRSVAVLPRPRIALPAGFRRETRPLMLANFDRSEATLYNIAHNFFPELGSLQGGEVAWQKVMPTAKFAKTHPEYFALTWDKVRACELKLGFDDHMMYCPSNPGVRALMLKAVEQQIAAGHRIIHLRPMDAYRLCHCNCSDCVKLFGSAVADFAEVRKRGDSGRLWQAYFALSEPWRSTHPKVRFVILNYQDTPVSAAIIKRFPDNVIVHIQYAGQHDFDKLAGVEFPAGISGFEETFTGFGQAGPYIAERTPEHMAEVVRAQQRNAVRWSTRDGLMGYVRGLQAPAYYVYGRMMDDPSADWRLLQEEFCEAAFGPAAKIMGSFFDLLHTQMAIYSDFFGVFMPAWDRRYSRSRHHDSKWHVMNIYSPEFCAEGDALLDRAAQLVASAEEKTRLRFIRLEWDYARRLGAIFHLQNAWTMNTSKPYLDPLLEAIGSWQSWLEGLAGGRGRSNMKPLKDWPQMTPFAGHFYEHAALEHEGYQQQWNRTCLNWDLAAIRAGALEDDHELSVAKVSAEPLPDSPLWQQAPVRHLRLHEGMPYANFSTQLQVLRDENHLYVRLRCLNPLVHPEDLYPQPRDQKIFSQEYAELALAPDGEQGPIYRLAVNPIEVNRHDSLCRLERGQLKEDLGWNGGWQCRISNSGSKGPYTLPQRTWTALFKIAFDEIGGKPSPGKAWGLNMARGRNGQSYLWKDAPYGSAARGLGRIRF